jgi:hypothetical protein
MGRVTEHPINNYSRFIESNFEEDSSSFYYGNMYVCMNMMISPYIQDLILIPLHLDFKEKSG